jgi:membrane protein
MLSIFPLLLFLISIMGFFLPSETVRQTVSVTIQRALPASTELIEQNINNIIRFRGLSGIFSIIALLWSDSNLFSAIGRAVKRAWDIRQDRKFYIRKLRDIGLVLGTGILLILSMLFSVAINFISDFDNAILFWLVNIGSKLIAFLFVLIVFLLIYKYMPNTRTSWKSTWPGALLAAILFELGRIMFILYLTQYASYERVYGSLASVIVLLFWIYISAIIMILGIEFNSEYARMRKALKRGGKIFRSRPSNAGKRLDINPS